MPTSEWRPLTLDHARRRQALSLLPGAVVLLFVGWQLAHFGYRDLAAMLPSQPAFYVVLVALYLALPVSEVVIFRRVWGVPATIIYPLLRKTIVNDLVVSYGGEAALYAWARRRLRGRVAPFGAIKDVSIMSAVVASLVTLTMLVAVGPWLAEIVPDDMVGAAWLSVVFVLAIPLVVAVFARRVFSLSRGDLWFIAGVHLLRLAASIVLMALLWSLVLPGVALTYWIALQAVRLLVSRLPLVPNKDMLFASITILIVGHDSAVTTLISLTAMALFALHLLCFALLTLGAFFVPRTS
jgi:hypothetical protein